MKDGYAICFNEWALDKDIKNELGLLIIISSLTADKGYCYASNDYFAKLFEVSQDTISRKISTLERKKYIQIEYVKRGCQVIQRKIRLTKISIHDCQKYQPTIVKNVKENNTSINNTNINNKYIVEIVNYLNLKANTNFRSSSKHTREHILARFKEKYTLEDFKSVIDKKTKEWMGTQMEKYLCPDTLFGQKFEKYVNQKEEKITTADLAKVMDFSDFN